MLCVFYVIYNTIICPRNIIVIVNISGKINGPTKCSYSELLTILVAMGIH